MTRCIIFLTLVLIASVASGDTWHGTNAQTLATGTLSAVNGDSVRIAKPDNSTTEIKLDALSIADRAAILDRSNKLSEFKQSTRTWTSSGGNFRVEGKVVSCDDASARLVLADSKVVNVPLDKLSKDDRDYLDRIKKLVAKSETNPFMGAQPTDTNPFGSDAAPSAPKTPNMPRATRSPIPATAAASDPNRKPNNETVTGNTATGIPEFTGPRGGVYHYSINGNKVYDKRK